LKYASDLRNISYKLPWADLILASVCPQQSLKYPLDLRSISYKKLFNCPEFSQGVPRYKNRIIQWKEFIIIVEPSKAVEIKNASFIYHQEEILKDVNLTVPQGDFATIVGPNGGGKTTLLKLLLGLLKPSTGTIKIFNEAPVKSRSKIGYMPQHSDLDMQFPVTVMDVALMGRLSKCRWGRYSKQDKEAAATALGEVKMGSYKKTHFNALSGGQKQRVLIARALCSEPELLLLDEPTSNIDQESEKDLYNILNRLNRRMTILLVSHDLGFTSQVVKSVICVNRQVVIHPTTTMDGTMIKDIYGGDFKMIRHDHRCGEMGHTHD